MSARRLLLGNIWSLRFGSWKTHIREASPIAQCFSPKADDQKFAFILAQRAHGGVEAQGVKRVIGWRLVGICFLDFALNGVACLWRQFGVEPQEFSAQFAMQAFQFLPAQDKLNATAESWNNDGECGFQWRGFRQQRHDRSRTAQNNRQIQKAIIEAKERLAFFMISDVAQKRASDFVDLSHLLRLFKNQSGSFQLVGERFLPWSSAKGGRSVGLSRGLSTGLSGGRSLGCGFGGGLSFPLVHCPVSIRNLQSFRGWILRGARGFSCRARQHFSAVYKEVKRTRLTVFAKFATMRPSAAKSAVEVQSSCPRRNSAPVSGALFVSARHSAKDVAFRDIIVMAGRSRNKARKRTNKRTCPWTGFELPATSGAFKGFVGVVQTIQGALS